MVTKRIKRDRTARLLRIQLLLGQYAEGLDAKTIARRCSIHVRTVYRDLKALETELNVPIWQEGKKRGIVEGYFLPPITFTLTEAITVFMCARLMYNHIRNTNPGMISTFVQLSSIFPEPLRKQIQSTIDHIEKLPRNEQRMSNYNGLINAWLSQRSIRILYQEDPDKEAVELTIDPYFIEANTTRHYNYVIGYCHATETVATFRIDRIVGDVWIDSSCSFEIPIDFDADDYCDTEWGSTFSQEKVETVKLWFSPLVSKAIVESNSHPPQKIDLQNDGSMIITLKTKNTTNFRNWLLSYGSNVEVLEPDGLRQQIINSATALLNIYICKAQKTTEPSDPKLLGHVKLKDRVADDKRRLKIDMIHLIRHKVLVENQSTRSVAKQLGVSRNTISRYVKKV